MLPESIYFWYIYCWLVWSEWWWITGATISVLFDEIVDRHSCCCVSRQGHEYHLANYLAITVSLSGSLSTSLVDSPWRSRFPFSHSLMTSYPMFFFWRTITSWWWRKRGPLGIRWWHHEMKRDLLFPHRHSTSINTFRQREKKVKATVRKKGLFFYTSSVNVAVIFPSKRADDWISFGRNDETMMMDGTRKRWLPIRLVISPKRLLLLKQRSSISLLSRPPHADTHTANLISRFHIHRSMFN